jgi:hypothetical protein
MPAGEPILNRGSGRGQPLGNDQENSDTGTGHARDCSPTPGQTAPGDRRSGARPARASATTAGSSPSTQMRHTSRLMRDICPEPRHPPPL